MKVWSPITVFTALVALVVAWPERKSDNEFLENALDYLENAMFMDHGMK